MTDAGLRAKSANIPEEGRVDIAMVIERNRMNFSFRESDMKYLFDMWDAYVGPGEMQLNCGHCRYYVLNRMKQFVEVWRKDGDIP